MYQFDIATNWYYNLTSSYTWTGSVAPGSTALVNLPPANVTGTGTHSLTAIANAPNGAIDINPYNGYKRYASSFFVFPSSGSLTPVAEGFEATTFPPANWMVNNPDASYSWVRFPVGGFGLSAESARIDFFHSPNGQYEELFLPAADLQWAMPGVLINFSVAYAQRTASTNDRLQVQVSTNCGLSWSTVYDKAGDPLKTHAPMATLFTPTAADWRAESVNLDSYIGSNDVLIKFKGTSNAGNVLCVDDINLQFVTGVEKFSSLWSVDVYPNPSNGILNVNLNLGSSQHVLINVYDLLGEVVATKEIVNTSGGIYPLNLSGMAEGTYVVQVLTDKSSTARKITLNK
jgi:hypothetical protein